MKKAFFVICCTVILTHAVVVTPASSPLECAPTGLVLSEQAEKIFLSRGWQVSYIVEESYPARAVIEEVTTALEAEGWKPLDHDPLNPGSSAPTHQWTTFPDDSGPSPVMVDQWLGWYENEAGEQILLGFRYQDRQAGGEAARKVAVLLNHEAGPEEMDAEAWSRR